jgi:hypothetical protein
MENSAQFDDEAVGLSEAGIVEMARRQLAASIAVAFVIALGAGFLALAPASRDVAALAPHKVASVQQPQFVLSGDHVASAKRFERELP